MNASDVVVKQPATPSIEEVRRILNEWSSTGFFRVRRLGDRMTIDEIRTLSSYTVRLRTQYEDRSVSRASRPYLGGAIDDHGMALRPWDIHVAAPENFEDRTEQLPVPHTESVHTCAPCSGFGKVNCGPCQGWGKVTCTWCNGRGYRERTELRTTTGPGGQPQTESVTVRDNCTCFDGKVNCTHCNGHGKVQCATCAGSGRVVSFDLLTVQFRAVWLVEYVNTTQVPEEQMKQAVGTVLADERANRIDTPPAVVPEADRLAADVLLRSHSVAHGDTRMLFQRLRVEQVGVHEVLYRYRSGESRRLWIFGVADRVHAPGAPSTWMRLYTVLGSIAAAVGGGGYLLFHFVLGH
jgi:hypothetical protein